MLLKKDAHKAINRNQRSMLTALSSLGLTFSNGLLGIIVTRIVIVQFGSDFNGLNSTANQIVNMLLILEGGFTLASNVALFAPLGGNDYLTINGILAATKKKFRRIGVLFIIVGTIISGLYTIFVNSDLNKQLIFTIICMAILPQAFNLLFTSTYRVLLQADQREYIINFFTLATTSTAHIVNIITIPLFKQMWCIRLVTMAFSMINCIAIIRYAKKRYAFLNLNVEGKNELILGTNDVMIQKITGVIYNSAPIVFLSLSPIGGTKLASVYAVYNSIFAIVKSMLHGIIDAPKQGLGQLAREADEKRLWIVFEQYEFIAIFAIFSLMTTAYSTIIPFVSLYTRNVTDINYLDYKIAIAMISISAVELYHIPSGQLINMSGRFGLAKKIQLVGTTAIISSMIIFGNKYGLYGFLAAVLITALLLAIIEMGFVHIILFRNKYKSLMKLTIPLAVTAVIICYVESSISIQLNGYASLLVYASIIMITNILIGAVVSYFFNRQVFLGLTARFKSIAGR